MGKDTDWVEAMGFIAWGETAGKPPPLSGGTPRWRQLSLCQGAVACWADASGAGAGTATCTMLPGELEGALTGLCAEGWTATMGAAAEVGCTEEMIAEGGCANAAGVSASARGLSAGLGPR